MVQEYNKSTLWEVLLVKIVGAAGDMSLKVCLVIIFFCSSGTFYGVTHQEPPLPSVFPFITMLVP